MLKLFLKPSFEGFIISEQDTCSGRRPGAVLGDTCQLSGLVPVLPELSRYCGVDPASAAALFPA